jgi:hypothetical protein
MKLENSDRIFPRAELLSILPHARPASRQGDVLACRPRLHRRRRLEQLVLTLLVCAPPAAAQWSRVHELPATDVVCVDVEQEVIAAGTDTVVFVSIDGGAEWRRSAQLSPTVASIQAVRLHDGQLFAGTFGQGVFVSDDLGATWTANNEGLVGGISDSQLFISSFEARGDSLFAGTFGAGVYVRRLLGSNGWSHFGEVFEPEQASNVNTLALGNGRLLAAAGSNGSVFWRDRADADWTPSLLGPHGALPGVQAHALSWTGSQWVVGTSSGLFLSTTGQDSWRLSNLGVVHLRWSAFAMRGPTLFAAFDLPTEAVIEFSPDDGQSWRFLEQQPGVFVYTLAAHGDELYAGRGDGLWRRRSSARSTSGLGVAGPEAPSPGFKRRVR